MEATCIPKHLSLSVTRGRWICHNICKRKMKWEGGRMEGNRYTSDCISKHNTAKNIKICQCHWSLGIRCFCKGLHFNSWLSWSAIKEGDSHHFCHIICLIMSVLTVSLKNLHEGSGTDCCCGCGHALLACGTVGQCSWLRYCKSAINLPIHFMLW